MPEKYPLDVISISSKGKKEARIFTEKGSYIRYTYKDAETGNIVQKGKESIILKPETGKCKKAEKEQLFIIPMKAGKNLLIKTKETKEKLCWDEKGKKVTSI